MSDQPEGWSSARLGEVVTLRGEKASPVETPDAPFLGLDGLEAHTSRVLHYERAGALKSSAARFSPGEVLYSRLRPYLNKVAVAEVEGLASAEFLVLKPKPGVEAEFVRRRIMMQDFLAFTADLDKGDRPRVDFDQISQFELGLPPTGEQKRIVAKVDGLTARTARARAELDRIPALVERYVAKILTQAFRGDLSVSWRALGRTERPLSLPTNGIDGRLSERPMLPTGWCWTSLGAVSEVGGGLTKNAKRSVQPSRAPFLRVANVYANELRLDDVSEIGCTTKELARTRLKSGDLLIVEGNGSLDQIGRVALWQGQIDNCTHQNHIIRSRPGSVLDPRYALFWLLSPAGRKAIETVASSSSGLHTLSISKVSGLPIPMCALAEQQEIVRRIGIELSRLGDLRSEQEGAIRLLPKLDQAILAKAFRGELVPQDPADEPASVLLDRIRAERAAAPGRRRKAAK